MTKEQFKDRIDKGHFLEWVEFDNNFYGTLFSELVNRQEEGAPIDIPVLETELEGMISARNAEIQGLYVYLAIQDLETLKQRLGKRGTQTPESIAKRIEIADKQMTRAKQENIADAWIVNDEIISCVDKLVEQIESNFGVEAEADWKEIVTQYINFG